MNTKGGKDASQIIAGPGKVSPPKREKYDTNTIKKNKLDLNWYLQPRYPELYVIYGGEESS